MNKKKDQLKGSSSNKNNILNKQTVRYESTEVIINKSGIIIRKLTEPKGLALSRNYINKPPKISSKIIAENLFSALGKDNKIIIKKVFQVLICNFLQFYIFWRFPIEQYHQKQCSVFCYW